MFTNDFIERRNADRRQAHLDALIHHFAECDRRVAARRKSDAQFVACWMQQFAAARNSHAAK